MDSAVNVDKVARTLPDLPSANDGPGRFRLDRQQAAIGYDTRFEKWGAKVDEYTNLSPSLTVDYAKLLTSSFGAGMNVSHHSDYSEVLFNGVYAPMRNFRIQMTGGQLRGFDHHLDGFAHASNTILQNNYQLNVKRYWDESHLLSDIGLAAYTAEASGTGSANTAASDLAFGRLDGYQVDLGLRPTSQSKIDVRHELGRVTYYLDDDIRDAEYVTSHRIRYSQYFDNCMRLQGGYSASAQVDQLDLNLSQDNWQISISHAQQSGGGGMSFRVGYAIPLGRSGKRSGDCGKAPETRPTFESIVDAATRRPGHFPREPLTVLKSEASTE